MNMSEQELHQLFTSASMGHVAYRAWAAKARHERRFNIARLFDALCEARGARAMRAFLAVDGVGATARNVDQALNGDEPQAVAMQRITGTSERSRELLGRAAQAMTQNRDLLASELGDLYVCTPVAKPAKGRWLAHAPSATLFPKPTNSFWSSKQWGHSDRMPSCMPSSIAKPPCVP